MGDNIQGSLEYSCLDDTGGSVTEVTEVAFIPGGVEDEKD